MWLPCECFAKTWATGMYPHTHNVRERALVLSHVIKVPHGNSSIWTQLTFLAKELSPPPPFLPFLCLPSERGL